VIIKYKAARATRRSAEVTLENDKERALTSSDLLAIIDDGKGVSYDYDTDSYQLNGEEFDGGRHFGGTVETIGNNPNHKLVTVFID